MSTTESDAKFNPALICQLPSGVVMLCGMQYLRGYCILEAQPEVPSINALSRTARAQFLDDMTRVGDALMAVTGAFRINYFLGGNSQQNLHAHIVPRYIDEPEHLRKNHPWSYPEEQVAAMRFDPDRDRELVGQLAAALQKDYSE